MPSSQLKQHLVARTQKKSGRMFLGIKNPTSDFSRGNNIIKRLFPSFFHICPQKPKP